MLVTAASVQDRDAAKPLLWNLRCAFPSITLTWADGGYAGKLVTWAKTRLRMTLQIVKRPDDLHTFKVLPRRWVVEDAGMDHPPPPHRPRLRTAARPPRDLRLLGHDHRHDPAPRPGRLSSRAGSKTHGPIGDSPRPAGGTKLSSSIMLRWLLYRSAARSIVRWY
jgi:hypothetical protein